VTEVVEVAPDEPRLLALHAALLAEMNALYGGTDETAPKPVVERARHLLVLDDDGEPVACGAVAPLHWPTAPIGTGEVKRVYVVPARRGRGVGRALMAAVTDLARECGHDRLWLETGDPQAGAVALYERSGWTRIPSYGQYADDPRTRCYELLL
jgi:GNAT superfamily N-acetyltransferase